MFRDKKLRFTLLIIQISDCRELESEIEYMAMPRLNMPKYKISERGKMNRIIRQLNRIGYAVDKAEDAIQAIEIFKIDKSQFEFPYGSFDEAKKHALAGDFYFDDSNFYMTDEEREQLKKDVEEDRLWVRRHPH